MFAERYQVLKSDFIKLKQDTEDLAVSKYNTQSERSECHERWFKLMNVRDEKCVTIWQLLKYHT